MRSITASVLLISFCALTAPVLGDEGGSGVSGEQLRLTGSLEFETAELLRARKYSLGQKDNAQASADVDHVWFGHAIGTFNVESNPAPRLKVRAAFEFRQYYMTMLRASEVKDPYLGRYQFNNFYLREGQGIYSFLSEGALSLDCAIGLMPYKYNPEVRSLGEFMFRSGTYPLFLLGEFDRPFARVTGMRAGLKYRTDLFDAGVDAMALIEREIRPFNDISLAVMGGINFLKIIDIGAGADFSRAIPVNGKLTTPTSKPGSRYLIDSAEILDSAGNPTGMWSYNYGFYTFKGTKLMARGTIDMVEFAGRVVGLLSGDGATAAGDLREIAGRSGFKVYGEMAVIGLKNYPANQIADGAGNPKGYTKVSERMPWMVGISVPMWKLLDACAFEIERFPSPNPDDYVVACFKGIPVPSSPDGPGYTLADYKPRWNWSLYMKKQVLENFSVVCQMGRDHQRWETNMTQTVDYDFEASMVKPDQWGWHLSGVFSF
jgi:hypothetical protein